MASSVEVKILGDASSLKRSFGDAEAAANGFGNSVQKTHPYLKALGVAAIAAGAAIATGLVVALKTGFHELQQEQQALTLTATLLKNLGSATNLTTGNIKTYADQIQSATGLQDDMVMSAENILLRYEDIAGDNGIFRRATQTTADLAVALNHGSIAGADMSRAATLLGKALADPEAAAGKLARAGIVLTDAQKENIATMIEHGNRAQALSYLLGILENKFHGVADAAGETVTGKIERLKRAWEELSQALAEKVLPYANRFLDWMLRIANAPTPSAKWQEFISGISSAFAAIDWGKLAADIGEKLGQALAAGVKKIPNLAGLLQDAFSGFGAVFQNIGEQWGRSLGNWMAAGLADGAAKVEDALAGIVDGIATVMEKMGDLPFTDANLFGPLIDSARKAADGLRADADGFRLMADNARNANKPITDISKGAEGLATNTAALAKAADAAGSNLQTMAVAFKASQGGFTVAEAAAVGLTAALGRIPGKVDVQALMHDEEFRSKLEALVAKINAMPGTKEMKAIALTEAATKLIQEYENKVKGVPDDHKTHFSTPGAEDAADKADKVKKHANDVPNHVPVHFSATGASAVIAAANAVAAAIAAVPTFVNTFFSQSGPGAPGLAGGTSDFSGGLAIVGERGPELVNLPARSSVTPATQTRQLLSDAVEMYSDAAVQMYPDTAAPGGKTRGTTTGTGGGSLAGSLSFSSAKHKYLPQRIYDWFEKAKASGQTMDALGLAGGGQLGSSTGSWPRPGGGLTVNVFVSGNVMTEHDLVRTVYDGIISGPGQLNPSLWQGRR